ncbi:type IX secretion system sortase PorU [Dysgonomonas sp. 520]|uniref:type IX secretion system sortase PorU n=1 Tax=Dysgonomonas sp. 520 TaxID=2302931 RepID=UPI0013D2C014|nr:type IX secretion system sortase PorU [Dysgonomonas sp. 520]NDW09887.1 hypothetical protein [Dysgonomonas sp. 520]
MFKKILLITVLFAVCNYASGQGINDGSRYAANSVLSKGNWYKVKISETGVYKLTYEDLIKIGLTNPKDVQIYGYGGWTLDENFQNKYIDDLPKISIWMSSSDAASFGPGDYILFYARGTMKWTYSNQKGEFEHKQNPYSSDAYYFITEDNSGANLVKNAELYTGNPSVTLTSFDDYVLHEKDSISISQSGYELYGEDLKARRNFSLKFPLTGIVSGAPAKIGYNFIARPYKDGSKMEIAVNGTQVKTEVINKLSDSYAYAQNVNSGTKGIVTTALTENSTIGLKYTPSTNEDEDKHVHLNYIRINYKRTLKPYGGVVLFRSKDFYPQVSFNISEANPSVLVFDVTDNTVVKKMQTSISGSDMSFVAPNTTIREYALVDMTKEIPKPEILGKIENQNLHALPQTDMVIIAQPKLQEQAERLARLHEKDSGLKCTVVSPEKIYNEFSSGNADATAYRRFVKMFYDRAGDNDDERPKYLLLFGDGTYDNRFVRDAWTQEDKDALLLTYQTESSLHLISSYLVEDYFGFMDDNSGTVLKNAKLNVAVGRIPARTLTEAEGVVNKIERYMKNEDRGIWQNMVSFAADDAAGKNSVTSEREHMAQSNNYADTLRLHHPVMITNKIYEDMYERFSFNERTRIPDARKEFYKKIDEGTLILSFVGHGSEIGWTDGLLTYNDVVNLNNSRLPVWLTATCTFCSLDSDIRTGGEMALLNPNGGAIALFSTSRTVYSVDNNLMNLATYEYIFNREKGKALRLGDIMRYAKTENTKYKLSTNENKLRFILVGDPALRLNLPTDDYSVQVTEINGKKVSDGIVNINCLETNTVKGQIVDRNGQKATDFNGMLESIVFDNEQDLKTRGNTKVDTGNKDAILDYKDYVNKIYMGKDQIVNGEFEISFTSPANVYTTGGNGKMSFYAYSPEKDIDIHGYFRGYKIAQAESYTNLEDVAPVISNLYLDKETFRSGDKVGHRPVFYAEVSDQTAINLSSQAGQDMSLLLDSNTEYSLTSSFVPKGTSPHSGYVKFQIPELTEGEHTLRFNVYDVWGNLASQSVNFIVRKGGSGTHHFSVSDNVVDTESKFVFTSDYTDEEISIRYEVYSANGVLQWTHEKSATADMMKHYTYNWDLKANNGLRLMPGIYTYKAIFSVDGVVRSEKSEKLIIHGQ